MIIDLSVGTMIPKKNAGIKNTSNEYDVLRERFMMNYFCTTKVKVKFKIAKSIN